jgi:hypothetical protein
MTIRTSNDIMAVERHAIHTQDGCDRIRSCDLRVRASEHLAGGGQPVQYLRAAGCDAAAVEVVYLPDDGRAGVDRGGGASWTDAGDPDDALERYLGLNGKGMASCGPGHAGAGGVVPLRPPPARAARGRGPDPLCPGPDPERDLREDRWLDDGGQG